MGAIIFRKHGYKLTSQRLAVIRAITSTSGCLIPVAVCEESHLDHPDIRFVTVCRTLELLAKLGLICELNVGGSCHSYTISASRYLRHLGCTNCGVIIDFRSYDLGELEQKLPSETGFEIDSRLLEFVGLYQYCQKGAT